MLESYAHQATGLQRMALHNLSLAQLLLNAKLRPTVANIVIEQTLKTTHANHFQANNLQQCAMAFLGLKTPCRCIALHLQEDTDVHRQRAA